MIFVEMTLIQTFVYIRGSAFIIYTYPVASWVTLTVRNLQMISATMYWFRGTENV
jgi:hypothetical protein